ncbi:hypothetical protein [Paenibacillus hamazuiensis]|uniref:hypothetical protein n=1 Tax=Paenibacillus hamazuiensis TaxID=2936508 RepID=UPI00200EB60E|nr:hypothetical protein [Paenibacillus hamazuiensis]
MPEINHINLKNAEGLVYCCLRNKLVKLDEEQEQTFCKMCKMYAGPAGGRGVECVWEDMRDVGNPHVVTDPHEEFKMNQMRQVGPNFLSTLIVFG